ncbi:hypothetical protein DPX16_12852 [Anabarilius grahami]|uniref:Uncharacterized protein n=1 Tax=Anabarilius grahami TaxID=495550 RepID=A0A3N0XD90_ANAGA|nr:hypothetical protein DPX16_12852 [Anabarilius grahami]
MLANLIQARMNFKKRQAHIPRVFRGSGRPPQLAACIKSPLGWSPNAVEKEEKERKQACVCVLRAARSNESCERRLAESYPSLRLRAQAVRERSDAVRHKRQKSSGSGRHISILGTFFITSLRSRPVARLPKAPRLLLGPVCALS